MHCTLHNAHTLMTNAHMHICNYQLIFLTNMRLETYSSNMKENVQC